MCVRIGTSAGRRAEDRAEMPPVRLPPEMLDEPAVQQGNDLEIEAEAGLDQPEHLSHICSKRCTLRPVSRPLVVAPPMLNGAVHSDTQLIITLFRLIRCRDLSLDHHRWGVDASGKRFGRFPNCAIRIITPIALHRAVVVNTDDIQSTITALDQSCAAMGNVRAEGRARCPGKWSSTLAPPMLQRTVG